jgi:addiction module RelB/DinJ family antitoxin
MDEGIDYFGDVVLHSSAEYNGGLVRLKFVIALEPVGQSRRSELQCLGKSRRCRSPSRYSPFSARGKGRSRIFACFATINYAKIRDRTPSRPLHVRLFDTRPRLGHNGYMSAIAQSRIDPELKRQAEAVLEEIGLKPRAALELFYKQIIKRRAIPFPVQADSPEDEVLSTAARRNKLADEF